MIGRLIYWWRDHAAGMSCVQLIDEVLAAFLIVSSPIWGAWLLHFLAAPL